MNREILFRGKCIDNGEWVEGYYIDGRTELDRKSHIGYLFGEDDFDIVEVDPSTVVQYTGLNDKNGNKIFEGDILRITFGSPGRRGGCKNYYVYYNDGCYIVEDNGEYAGILCNYVHSIVKTNIEIIGNIHDNPELLEDG